jgi:hypothetical protein
MYITKFWQKDPIASETLQEKYFVARNPKW